MAFQLSCLWITIALLLSLVCATKGAAVDDYEVVRKYLYDELEKTTATLDEKVKNPTPDERVNNLVRLLFLIDRDVEKKVFKDNIQSLARFLELKLFNIFDMYLQNILEFSSFEDIEANETNEDMPKFFEDLNDPESVEAALEIMRKETEKEHIDSLMRTLTSTFVQLPQDLPLTMLKSILLKSLKGSPIKIVSSGKIVNPWLLSAQLSYDVIDNMHKWWKNEISGKRCATNIIHNAGVTMGGISGANTGIFVGNLFFGAPGAVVGALGGAYLGSMSAGNQMDHLIYDIFDRPKSEAVEKAYHFFGLDSGASISEIYTAYLQKATVFNPLNKVSGDAEKNFEVQVQMQILRMVKS